MRSVAAAQLRAQPMLFTLSERQRVESKPIGTEFWSLLDFCSQEGRVCPNQGAWHQLWQMLPHRREVLPPSKQADTAATERDDATDNALKWLLIDHLLWAHRKGVFAEVDRYLRGLGPEQWLLRR